MTAGGVRKPIAGSRNCVRGWVSLLLVAGFATGCTAIVGGAARPAPGLVPRPLTGREVERALLDNAELNRAFGQSFKTDPDQPGGFGGSELLQENAQTPPDCGGVVDPLLKDSYAGSEVRAVATSDWMYSSPNPAAIAVQEAVVALPDARAADAAFSALARRWRSCGGATMTIGGDPNFTSRVGSIAEKNSVLSAPIDDISSYMTMPEARAVGVRVNCLLEVKVVYYASADRDGSSAHTATAVDVAQLLMQKVISLT